MYIGVGLSTLLVPTNRAMRRPLHRGTGNKDWLHVFVCMADTCFADAPPRQPAVTYFNAYAVLCRLAKMA